MKHKSTMIKVLLVGGLSLLLVCTIATKASAASKDITVDCTKGETVTDALGKVALETRRVIIVIKGTCIESVRITRNNVTLQGASPGDGLQAPSPGSTVLMLIGAHRTRLEQLTITGGNIGLNATGGSAFGALDLHIIGAANYGVLMAANSFGNISNSIVEQGGNFGLGAVLGGSLFTTGTTVDDHDIFGVSIGVGGSMNLGPGTVVQNSGGRGVQVGGGSLTMQDATVQSSIVDGIGLEGASAHVRGSGSFIQNNGRFGVAVGSGSSFWLSDGAHVANNGDNGIHAFGGGVNITNGAIVEDNTRNGVELHGSSSAAFTTETAGVIIQDNGEDGIRLRETSVATFDGTAQVINNVGYGIICELAPSVAQISGTPPIVSGNGNDTIACP
jgi:hypothetical protein